MNIVFSCEKIIGEKTKKMLGISEADVYTRQKQLKLSRSVRLQADMLHAEIKRVLMREAQDTMKMLHDEIYRVCLERIPWWKKLLRQLSCISDVDFHESINEERAKYVRTIDVDGLFRAYGLARCN